MVAPLESLGAVREERAGSRVAFSLAGRTLVMHRPHPGDELNKAAVRDVRDFLRAARGL